MKSKKTDIIFIICFLAVCLVPLLFMPWAGNQKPVGKENAPKKPTLVIKSKDKINKEIIPDAGEYFSKAFAFRNELINTGDMIKGKLFGVSAQSGVIMGKSGWMFYSNTFEDFQGIRTLSDYRIMSSIYNLKLIQKRLQKKDIRFLFTIAPNKNSLYPEKMRAGYKISPKTRNSARLIMEMKKNGINYADLYHLFENEDEVLYHKTDSHWNNKGAAMVSSALQKALGHKYTDWSKEKYEVKHDFQGDLAAMVYPLVHDKDKEIYYDRDLTFRYTSKKQHKDRKITDQSVVMTENRNKKGDLVMLRDSFGISLVPFMAEDYRHGLFLNKSPYDLQSAVSNKADTAIFELVERNLSYLTTDAPELDMGRADLKTKDMEEDTDYHFTVTSGMSDDALFTKLYGHIDPEKTNKKTMLYLCLTPADGGKEFVIPAFRTTRYGEKENEEKEYGFSVYAATDSLPAGDYSVRLIYGSKKEDLKITEKSIDISVI